VFGLFSTLWIIFTFSNIVSFFLLVAIMKG
jgi:hypothetical protein